MGRAELIAFSGGNASVLAFKGKLYPIFKLINFTKANAELGGITMRPGILEKWEISSPAILLMKYSCLG